MERSLPRDLLREMLAQHRVTCSFVFERITDENATRRVCPGAASVGFIYRHIGETMNLFGTFFGVATDVENTTIGHQDDGRLLETQASARLVQRGYTLVEQLIEETPDSAWLEPIETPFFGTVSRVRLMSHILYHTASHAGQIALTLARAQGDVNADGDKGDDDASPPN